MSEFPSDYCAKHGGTNTTEECSSCKAWRKHDGALQPVPASSGVKHDSGKAPLSLLDRKALESIAEVLAFGAEKYAAHNWRAGFDHTRLSDAALRHIFAWIDGEDADPESGLSHIAHAQCCLMFLQRMIIEKPERDDRYKEKAQ